MRDERQSELYDWKNHHLPSHATLTLLRFIFFASFSASSLRQASSTSTGARIDVFYKQRDSLGDSLTHPGKWLRYFDLLPLFYVWKWFQVLLSFQQKGSLSSESWNRLSDWKQNVKSSVSILRCDLISSKRYDTTSILRAIFTHQFMHMRPGITVTTD